MTPIQDLRCLFLNAENLYLMLDSELPPDFTSMGEKRWSELSSSIYDNKPLRKLIELQKMILELDPDIVLFAEVGGLESLSNFNTYFLGGNYYCALIEGNSDRNIDVGYLIHKRCPFHFDLVSNKDRDINFLYPHEIPQEHDSSELESHKFSRDASELHLFTRMRDKPFCIFILAHLKSPLDPERIDSGGVARREAELKTLVEIYRELNSRFQVPVIVAGDFNGNASQHHTDKEFQYLYENTDLKDVLEIEQIPIPERCTFYLVRSGGKVEGRQIDYVFLSKLAQPHLKTGSALVYRYKNELGNRPLQPTTLEEKLLLPSDHYPVVFELKGLRT